jgi:hypothetical protein
MSRKIEIISGINVNDNGGGTLTNNMVMCIGCQNVVITAQNVHNQALDLDGILTSLDTGNGALTLININGAPVSFPYNIPVGGTFTFTLQVCSDGSLTQIAFRTQFSTVQHNVENAYYYFADNVTFESLFDTSSIDFGTVLPNFSQSQNIIVINSSIGTVSYDIDYSSCSDMVLTNASGAIPAGGSSVIGFTWTPISAPQSFSCSFSVTEVASGGACAFDIPVVGEVTDEYDCDIQTGICCVNIQIQTPNGYLDTVTGICDTTQAYDSSAILDYKKVICDFKYRNENAPSGIPEELPNGLKIYFSHALFSATGNDWNSLISAPPGQAWYYPYNQSMPDGNLYPMSLIGTGAYSQSQKNYKATFVPVDYANGYFRIIFEFYLVADYEEKLNNVLFDHQTKYRKNAKSSLSEFTNTTPSVYNSLKNLSLYVGAQFTSLAYSSYFDLTKSIPFTSRFYNKGLYDTQSEFTSPTFTLIRNSNIVSDLSTFQPTQAVFNITINSGLYNGCEAIVFHLIDLDKNNTNDDLLFGVDASRAEIINFPGSNVLNNNLESPSVFTNLGGDVWEARCLINTQITAGDNYMLFAIVYGNDGVTVNTFKSQPYSVRRVPDYDCFCKPTIESSWSNYFKTLDTNDYRPVGKERIQHKLKLTAGDFQNCLEDWGLTEQVTDWRVALTSITVRVYKRVMNFPTANKVTFFEYAQASSIRNGGFFGGWQNLGILQVTDFGTDEITTEINNYRVPWELTPFGGSVFTADISTYMNKISAGANSTSYINAQGVVSSWIDEDIYFEYQFEFNMSSIFNSNFVYSICKAFMVNAISFENINSGFPDIIVNATLEGFSPVSNTWLALGNNINILNYSELRFTFYSTQDGWFSLFYETAPFGIGTLQESNAPSSPTGMVQYWQAPIIVAQDEQYDQLFPPQIPSNAAVVNLDPAQFENKPYLFCAYYSELDVNLCRYMDRHFIVGGSFSFIQGLTPQFSDTLAIAFVDVPVNRYLFVKSNNPTFLLPVVGNTYYFEYIFAAPLSRAMDIYIGQNSFIGSPTFTIPIGETIGSVAFVWPSDPQVSDGRWSMVLRGGTNYTSAATFKIGTQDCGE